MPLEALPSEEALDAPRVAPTIRDVDGALAALGAGFYAEVAAALPSLSRDPRVPLLEGELAFATCRFDDAAEAFAGAAAVPALRTEARTRGAEAHARRGRYDEALALLAPLGTDPSAHRAHLVEASIEAARGRHASALYYRLINAYNDGAIEGADELRYVALAAAALGAFRDANDAFRESAAADPDDVETQLAWAALFLSKHDPGHAEESVRAALAHNPESPEALLALARVVLEQSFDVPRAKAALSLALETCPALVGAHTLRAGFALRDLDFEGVEAELSRALAVNPRDLEALSVRAAARFLAGDTAGYEAAKAAVLREHPGYAELYSIMAEYVDFEHRYPALVRFGREAVALDPRSARAYALLGTNLLRTGEEEEGLEALREAFRRDRYDVRVYNTLNLFEDVLATQYELFDSGPFVFRMNSEERPLLERYAPPLLTRAYGDMRRRYGVTPEGPIRMELYASEEHFSVRTSGLPRMGLQGVCFGEVVTAVSPAGGPYNFAQITWHELAHVFHLTLSNYSVPRWLTEGLAEYETDVAGLGFRREYDPALLAAIERDALPPLSLLNNAFTSARTQQDMLVAYYAANQVVHYLVSTYGFPAVVEMLRAYGRGLDTEAVFRQALGTTSEEVDRGFRAHTRARLAHLVAQYRVDLYAYADLEARAARAAAAPEDAALKAAHAAALTLRGQRDAALSLSRAALAKDPDEPLALFLVARLGLEADPASARAHIEKLIALGHDGYDLRLIAARAALRLGDRAAGRAHLEAAVLLDPDRQDAHRSLLTLAEQEDDAAGRLAALRALAALDEHDRAIHAAYLDALVATGDRAALIAEGERAVYVDPHRAATHLALGRALLEAGKRREARFELESARLADPALAAEIDALLSR